VAGYLLHGIVSTFFESQSDKGRAAFLRRLDAAPFEVTEWEAKFVADLMGRDTYTERQREKIDQLRETYEHRLPASAELRRGKPAEARDPNTAPPARKGECGYLIMECGKRRRCGLPAKPWGKYGLELCEAHASQAEEWEQKMAKFKERAK
jgi:hypothetical protein